MRLYDAIFHGTVPAIIAEGIVQPYERYLDWESFTVKLRDDALVLPPPRVKDPTDDLDFLKDTPESKYPLFLVRQPVHIKTCQ